MTIGRSTARTYLKAAGLQVVLSALPGRDSRRRARAQANRISNAIFGAWNSNIAALIDGTESWGTAFAKTVDDILVKFLEMCEQMIAKWLIMEVLGIVTGGASTVATGRR